MTEYRLRTATLDDVPSLEQLIRLSAHELSKGDYSPAQVDKALQGVFGVDTQLLVDQTYFVIEVAGDSPTTLAACGGWSYRATLFGSDQRRERDPRSLDPRVDAAKIRAFFVHPDHARQGLGTRLLDHCERCARDGGFDRLEMGATVPGQRMYERRGYRPVREEDYPMGDGLALRIITMAKTLDRE